MQTDSLRHRWETTYTRLFSAHTRLWLGILMAGYAAFTLCVFFFHEPWRDELQAWLIARELNIPDILYQMRYEGHFALWSLMLKPFASAGGGLLWMGLLSWALMQVAAWILLYRSPFSGWVKALLLLSYPMIYYFPVVSRCYALIPPILFLLAVLYERLPRGRGHFAYCLLLGLLAHTHAYMEGMVGMLFLIYTYDYLIRHWKQRSWKLRLKSMLPPFLTVGLVIGAALQVLPALSMHNNATDKGFTIDKTLGYITDTVHPDQFPLMDAVTDVLLILILVAFIIRYRRGYNPRIPLLLLGAIGWQIYFSTELYGMNLQRPYLILYVLIFAFWIVRSKALLPQLALALISLFTLYRLPYGLSDFSQPYTNAQEIATLLQKTLPKDKRTVYVDNMTKVIAGYAPELEYRSMADGKKIPLYTPHDLLKTEPFERYCDSISKKPLYYVRNPIRLEQFAKYCKERADRYEVEQILPRKGAPTALQETFYLYRIRRK